MSKEKFGNLGLQPWRSSVPSAQNGGFFIGGSIGQTDADGTSQRRDQAGRSEDTAGRSSAATISTGIRSSLRNIDLGEVSYSGTFGGFPVTAAKLS
jgi:hypothetical protein